jgi:hypothetical protein
VDPNGLVVTLYPLSTEGAVVPPGYDAQRFNQDFCQQLTKMMARAGVSLVPPVPGQPAEGMSIQGRIVRIEPGSALVRFLLGWLGALVGGGAIFEIEAGIGTPTGLMAPINVTGKNPFGMPWGKNESGIKTAAVMAANSASKTAVNAIKAR